MKPRMLCIPTDEENLALTLKALTDLPMHKDKRAAKKDVFTLVRLEKPPTKLN